MKSYFFLIELFFGRLDSRTAINHVTKDLVGSYFGGEYSVIGPGAEAPHDRPPKQPGAPIEIFMDGVEERAAQRILIRALRKLPRDLEWHATFRVPAETAVAPPSLSNRMRERTTFVSASQSSAADLLATADIAIAASAGTAPSPGYVARIVASGAAPLTSFLEPYKEALDDGELGLMFESGNAQALSDQLERLIADHELLARLRANARRYAENNTWDAVASRFEELYYETRARRHDLIPAKQPKPHIADRVARRKRIDVDLHMHTNHSHDCATPVEVLLETAKVQGLGAIAVTDHNLVSGAHEAAKLADQEAAPLSLAVTRQGRFRREGRLRPITDIVPHAGFSRPVIGCANAAQTIAAVDGGAAP